MKTEPTLEEIQQLMTTIQEDIKNLKDPEFANDQGKVNELLAKSRARKAEIDKTYLERK